MARWLDGGSAELAVLAVLVNTVVPGGVRIGADRFCAVLRADHPLAGEPLVDLVELADDSFLLSAGGCEGQIAELHRMAGVPLAPVHRVWQLSTLFAMVRAGVGVSVVPGLADGMPGAGAHPRESGPRAQRVGIPGTFRCVDRVLKFPTRCAESPDSRG